MPTSDGIRAAPSRPGGSNRDEGRQNGTTVAAASCSAKRKASGMSDPRLENASDAEEDSATREPGGLGEDGTIPPDPDGVAAGHTGESSTFEPEEDGQVPE